MHRSKPILRAHPFQEFQWGSPNPNNFSNYFQTFCLNKSRMVESTSKHWKPSDREEATMVDRISNLLESLLCHILLFLRTKEAIVTSILSSRWNTIWTLVPNLDLDDDKFGWESYRSYWEQSPDQDQDQDQLSFADVLSRIWVLRESNPLKTFCLVWCCECDPILMDRWVRIAIAHDLEELNLDLCLA